MILYRYVLREYFRFVSGIVVLCVFLFVMFDFLHKTTKYFAKYQPQKIDVTLFYLYQVPSIILQVLPIAALLSSVITMVLLSRSNEITAMRAAGMGPLRVGMPIAVGGLILSFFSLAASEIVLPKSAERMHFVEQVKIMGASTSQITEGARWFRDGEKLINFGTYDPKRRVMSGIKIVEVNSSFRPKVITEAASANYLKDAEQWRLDGVKVIFFRSDGQVDAIDHRGSLILGLPVDPNQLKRERRLPNELSFSELKQIVEVGQSSGTDVSEYQVDRHVKMAYPFAAFVVSLIGLKFGFRSERSLETAKSILFAFAIGISYWIMLSSGRALGRRGDLPAILAAWLPNIVVFAMASIMIWRSRKPA